MSKARVSSVIGSIIMGPPCRSPRGVTAQRVPSAAKPAQQIRGGTMGVLDGKVAVVAGASRGIGRGIATELGAAGAVVYATGRTLDPGPAGSFGSLSGTVGAIEDAGGVGIAVRCDHTADDEVAALFDRVRSEH